MSAENSEKMRQMTALWLKSCPTVTAYIASVIRDRHHVEDLVQEVAFTISDQVDKFDSTRPFLPWALGIARIRILKYLRTRKRDRHVFDDGLLDQLAVIHEKQADESSARKAALHDCMKRLSPDRRELLENRYFKDVAVKEIATSVDRTEGAVSMLLLRIRQQLAICIRKRASLDQGGTR